MGRFERLPCREQDALGREAALHGSLCGTWRREPHGRGTYTEHTQMRKRAEQEGCPAKCTWTVSCAAEPGSGKRMETYEELREDTGRDRKEEPEKNSQKRIDRKKHGKESKGKVTQERKYRENI